jgi:hypothetical protein
MMAGRRTLRMARYTLYGIGDGPFHSFEDVGAYFRYKFPITVQVPEGYEGAGASHQTETLFREAFEEIAACATQPACDRAFRQLGLRMGLKDVLARWTLHFFAFAPDGEQGRWPPTDDGITFAQVTVEKPNVNPPYAEIGIHICAMRSAGFLAATLLHELAHIAGAPGASAADFAAAAAGKLPQSAFRRLHAAEHAVWACGLRAHYKKHVIGALERIGGRRPV